MEILHESVSLSNFKFDSVETLDEKLMETKASIETNYKMGQDEAIEQQMIDPYMAQKALDEIKEAEMDESNLTEATLKLRHKGYLQRILE